VAGRAPTIEQIAGLINSTPEDVEKALAELEKNQVFSRDKRKIIYSRRMVRAQKNRGNGRLGGHPKPFKTKENQNSLNHFDRRPLTAAERSLVEDRKRAVELMIEPYGPNDRSNLAANVGVMLSGFRSMRQQGEAAETTIAITLTVLREFPAWAIQSALRYRPLRLASRWLSGGNRRV
jgi:hypothetical protein